VNDASSELEYALDDVLQRDAAWAKKRLAAARRGKRSREKTLREVRERLSGSAQRVRQRARSVPELAFDPDLPITAHRDELVEAIRDHQLIIVAGETGSGKSTQLPKLCLEAGRGQRGLIGCTQPRRIAARSVSARVAQEIGVDVGGLVGFQVRFTDRTAEHTLVKFMTDGILLAETQADRWLDDYDTIIIDEAHERSLNIDFLLGLLKRLLPRRPDLRVIVTSATIDPERFANYFDDAPVFQVSGRTYPVETRYRPFDEDDGDRSMYRGIGEAVDELSGVDPRGDILVFLSGEREIREAAAYLRKRNLRNTEILPLYARLGANAQMKVFHPGKERRIVLATNVAETSLTVPRIRFVIDTGTARISRFSHRSRVQRLPIEPISQASAEQRKGRCGRLGPGVCIRLYSEQDFEQRPQFTEPEILRTSLATVILRMLAMRLGEIEAFPFLDPPPRAMISDALQLLRELQAVDDDQRQLTDTGRKLAELPMDVRHARTLIEAERLGCLAEMLVLTAALSIQDPRERPLEQAQAADQAHGEFAEPKSDFAALLNLWDWFVRQQRELGSSALRRQCQQQFLSWVRMREWRDLRRQYTDFAKQAGWTINRKPADPDTIHQALLAGLLSHVARRDEDDGSYLGARGRRFWIFPGSGLAKGGPRWLMAAEIVETSRVFARVCAAIKPEWIERQGAHLLRHHYYDPYWSKKRGRVMGYCQSTLYGLPVVERRRVHYAPHDPDTARRIFIEHALVRGEMEPRFDFHDYNERLAAELEAEEHKRRRRDVLEREEQRVLFFEQRLPAEVCDVKTFKQWYSGLEDKSLLHYQRDTLLREGALFSAAEAFPESLSAGGHEFPLAYRFEPGAEDDGVTLTTAIESLNRLDPAAVSWLVPGLLEDKVIALINTLPKPKRRAFTPAKDFARACMERFAAEAANGESLTAALSRILEDMSGTQVSAGEWGEAELPDHLRMRIRLVDDRDRELAAGRDLQRLQADWGSHARRVFMRNQGAAFNRDGVIEWDFGELPESVTTPAGVEAWPALVDQQHTAGLRLFDDPGEAWTRHHQGVVTLARLQLRQPLKYLEKNHELSPNTRLAYGGIDHWQRLRDDLIQHCLDALAADAGQVRTRAGFDELVAGLRAQLLPRYQQAAATVAEIVEHYHVVNRALDQDFAGSRPAVWEDMRSQLDDLVYAGFVRDVPAAQLEHYPRYLKAMRARLERLDQDPKRDRQRQDQIDPYWQRYLGYLENEGVYTEELDDYRWLLEEYRVSLFAQELGTAGKVSAKRLEKAWEAVVG